MSICISNIKHILNQRTFDKNFYPCHILLNHHQLHQGDNTQSTAWSRREKFLVEIFVLKYSLIDIRTRTGNIHKDTTIINKYCLQIIFSIFDQIYLSR